MPIGLGLGTIESVFILMAKRLLLPDFSTVKIFIVTFLPKKLNFVVRRERLRN